jgi:ferrochelatase
MPETAVLLMAYGSPRSIDEVKPYFTDIRGGRPPSPDALKELLDRYERIGGRSPLNEITAAQADGLRRLLSIQAPERFKVLVGMKHWHPFVPEAVAEICRLEIPKVVGLVLAPHYSAKSIGEYEKRILKARDENLGTFELTMVPSWYDEPPFIDLVTRNLTSTLEGWDPGDGATRVFFSAHSIPARIVEAGDPYADQLSDSARLYAERAGITDYETAWQSASATGEPWLGPDILDRLEAFAAAGGHRAVVAPVGFVCDHLEVLFDVDVECVDKAAELGLELRRIPSPNADPELIRALADVVMRYAQST